MFTEATEEEVADAVANAPAAAAAEGEAKAPASPAPAAASSTSAGAKPRRGDADAPSKKRGWTMFMEKPLADAKKDPLGGVAPSAGESNAKGWTVFSPAADVQAEAAAASPPVPAAAPSVAAPPPNKRIVTTPAFDAAPSHVTSGHSVVPIDEEGMRAQAAADEDRLRIKTLVVTGPPDPAIAARPMTMVTPPASPGPAPGPITVVNTEPPMAAMSHEQHSGPMRVMQPMQGLGGPMSGPVSGPLSGALSGPVSGPMSGPVSTGMPVLTEPDAMMPASKRAPVVPIVVGVAIAAAAIVAAIVLLT